MNMQRLLVASAVFFTALSIVGCGQKKDTEKAKAPAEASHNVKSYDNPVPSKPVNPSEPVGQNTSPNVVPTAGQSATVAQEPEALSYIPPIEETATSSTTMGPSATAPASSTAQPSAPSSVNNVPANLNVQPAVSASVKNAPINSVAQPSESASVKNAPVNSNTQPSVSASVNSAPVNSNTQPSVSASVNSPAVNSNAQPGASASVNTAPVNSSVQPSVPASGNITPTSQQVSSGAGSVIGQNQGQTSAPSTVSNSPPVLTGSVATPAAVTPLKSSQ